MDCPLLTSRYAFSRASTCPLVHATSPHTGCKWLSRKWLHAGAKFVSSGISGLGVDRKMVCAYSVDTVATQNTTNQLTKETRPWTATSPRARPSRPSSPPSPSSQPAADTEPKRSESWWTPKPRPWSWISATRCWLSWRRIHSAGAQPPLPRHHLLQYRRHLRHHDSLYRRKISSRLLGRYRRTRELRLRPLRQGVRLTTWRLAADISAAPAAPVPNLDNWIPSRAAGTHAECSGRGGW